MAVVGDALESLREYVNGSPEGFEDSDHDHTLAAASLKLTARDSRRRRISNETAQEIQTEEDEATLRELLVRYVLIAFPSPGPWIFSTNEQKEKKKTKNLCENLT